jgi:hypothetical protein
MAQISSFRFCCYILAWNIFLVKILICTESKLLNLDLYEISISRFNTVCINFRSTT